MSPEQLKYFNFLANNNFSFYEHFLDAPKNSNNKKKEIYYSFGILCFRFFDDIPKILLVQKYNKKRKPHIWGFPKGSPSNIHNETKINTANREFLEETQTTNNQRNFYSDKYNIIPTNPIQSSYEGYCYIEISSYFIAYTNNYNYNINPKLHDEICNAEWVSLYDLDKYIKKKRYDLIRIAYNGFLQLINWLNINHSNFTNLYL